MTPRVVVFTAVFGPDVDRLRPPQLLSRDAEYRCYTDQPHFTVSGWQMVHFDPVENPLRQARMCKILAHKTEPECDVSIWIDSAYSLKVHPWALIQGEFSVRALQHPWRDTVREEMTEIVHRRLADPPGVFKQVLNYESLWRQEQLTSTGLLVRVHTPNVNHFNEYWWEEVTRWGHFRDQMSVDYSAFATKVPIEYLPGNYRDNRYADWKAGRRRVA